MKYQLAVTRFTYKSLPEET